MKSRVLVILLWVVGALSLLFVPAMLLYNGWPIDLPIYFNYGLLVRPHLSSTEWDAVRNLLILFTLIGITCLWVASRKDTKEANNADK